MAKKTVKPSKKKSTAKKKAASTKKTATQTKRAVATRKTAAKAKSAAKKQTGKAKAPAKRKPVSVKELISRKFEAWQPETLFVPAADDGAEFSAPPSEADRAVLLRTFDYAGFPEKAETPPPPPRKPVSVSELIARKFEAWQPEALFVPAADDGAEFSAPSSEADRALLLRTFDYANFPEKAETPPPSGKPVSVSELIARKFGAWQPDTLFVPAPDDGAEFSAPPSEADRAVLLRTFDYENFPEKAETPPPPGKPVSVSELIARKFEAWQPETLFVPAGEDISDFSAPPSDADKAVLLRTFDYENFPVRAGEPAPREEDNPPETPAVPQEPAPAEEKKPEPPPAPKKPVSVKELLSRKFEAWKPEKMFVPAPDDAADFSSPPFDADKAILFRIFDYENFPTAPETSADAQAIYEPPVRKRDPKPPKKGFDPMERMIRFAIAGFAVVIAIILIASFSNTSRYYLRPTAEALEIWQGNFAPLGQRLLVALPGVQTPESVKTVYTREEVFPIAFNYYIEKADVLLETPGLPDFKAVKAHLHKAMDYGTDVNVREALVRLKNIDLIVLMNLADIAASKGTADGFETALTHLDKAAAMVNKTILLEVKSGQTELINRKVEMIREMLAKLEADQTEKAAEPSEEIVEAAEETAEPAADEGSKAESAETETASSESEETAPAESGEENAETSESESAEAASDHN